MLLCVERQRDYLRKGVFGMYVRTYMNDKKHTECVLHTYRAGETAHHCNDSPYKLEVVQMLWVDARPGVDLQAVAVPRVLKQAVHWVQHLMREHKEPLPAWTDT